METKVIQVFNNPKFDIELEEASRCIRDGGLVVFPTETVYGLGANALLKSAVANIYTAKGRPSDNPLIVHIDDLGALKNLVSSISSKAQQLMAAFWPGPLTLVLPKSQTLQSFVTAGLNTVAVRMPSNDVARKLIRLSGVPIAAPSANLSGSPSPTLAKHVIEDLYGRVDFIIDGGPCDGGIESTVIDMTEEIPILLRPGHITLEALQALLGIVHSDTHDLGVDTKAVPRSPGMKYRHYAPKANLTVINGSPLNITTKVSELAYTNLERGVKTIILATDQTLPSYAGLEAVSAGDRNHPETIAKNLFRLLRKFDKMGYTAIIAEGIEANGVGMAVMNRLIKASSNSIIHV